MTLWAPWIRLIVLDLALFFFFKAVTLRNALRESGAPSRKAPAPAPGSGAGTTTSTPHAEASASNPHTEPPSSSPHTESPQLQPTPARILGYCFAWPGMNAKAFLSPMHHEHRPKPRDWFFAVLKVVIGLLLVGVILRHVPRNSGGAWTIIRDWTALIGLGLIVPFGLFHVIALAWQSAGVHARPIMDRPFWSVSLTEFWGRRWNLAVHDLMHDLAFRLLLRRWGMRGAVAAVFILSGLFHELVLSLPAGGGFGLPTLFFLLQFAGVTFERTPTGRRLGLGKGWTGRVYVWLLTITPAYAVFHRAVLDRVMFPWLERLGVV